jgi:hypothetical protein
MFGGESDLAAQKREKMSSPLQSGTQDIKRRQSAGGARSRSGEGSLGILKTPPTRPDLSITTVSTQKTGVSFHGDNSDPGRLGRDAGSGDRVRSRRQTSR